MSFFEAVLFGLVQGLTEFLPISSTAHIVILQLTFGYTFPGLSFEILLHLSSIAAVLVYFHRDVRSLVVSAFRYLFLRDAAAKPGALLCVYLIVATGVTAVFGLLLKPLVENSMKTPLFVAGALLVTAAALVVIDKKAAGTRTEAAMTARDAWWIGLGQTLAVLPGISRSGATLLTALALGIERDTAVRFSFLLALPVILGSTVLALEDLQSTAFAAHGWAPLATALVTAFCFSLLSIAWLIRWVRRQKLVYFAVYCAALAVVVLVFFEHDHVIEVYSPEAFTEVDAPDSSD
ncbi:undecaprenyl-diphosphatase [Salsuginibacillus halophilus]|uniref:Undecaprenyl-diphosphatase n=1 Tax=Salsuginibacillus halophilus TaxID=517424 RepID=A0A2P8HAP3_9BACI|nr:undecaprenyl-diphosphate phosphatase [Salsuginibacillus halophilus]PSL43282.1 undecaprenyl-diphosphatase [Salsuginibacillus halophilus]